MTLWRTFVAGRLKSGVCTKDEGRSGFYTSLQAYELVAPPEAVNRRPSKQEAGHMAGDGHRAGELSLWKN